MFRSCFEQFASKIIISTLNNSNKSEAFLIKLSSVNTFLIA